MVADALSRLSTNAIHTGDMAPVVDYRAMAATQEGDHDLTKLQTNSSLQVPLALSNSAMLWCDVSTGVPRPFVPKNLQSSTSLIVPSRDQGNSTPGNPTVRLA